MSDIVMYSKKESKSIYDAWMKWKDEISENVDRRYSPIKASYMLHTDIAFPVEIETDIMVNYLILGKASIVDLKKYADIFIDRFSPALTNEKTEFVVEILKSDKYIGMLFKIYDKGYNDKITIVNKPDKEIIEIANELMDDDDIELELLDKENQLFGFKEKFFFVFKCNIKKLWSKDEGNENAARFMDAILKENKMKVIDYLNKRMVRNVAPSKIIIGVTPHETLVPMKEPQIKSSFDKQINLFNSISDEDVIKIVIEKLDYHEIHKIEHDFKGAYQFLIKSSSININEINEKHHGIIIDNFFETGFNYCYNYKGCIVIADEHSRNYKIIKTRK